MTTAKFTRDTLNSLLRGELSAIETYSRAIHKFPGSGAIPVLEEIRAGHLQSVSALRGLIQDHDGHPVTDSGMWGDFAKGVEAAAALLGVDSAIAALRQGENFGIGEYESALGDPTLPAEVKLAIQENLLPALQNHLLGLDSLRE
jgi:hypothetical protein